MTRYRITSRPAGHFSVQRFDYDTARWVTLPNKYDAPTAELAGRTVDALMAMEKNRETA